uniref:Anthranilate synthase component 2 n=1 Tax=Gelidium kathyanniae TaxID=2483893 RepID=A0A3G2QXZ7_9FLOR|nr:anthranilate synthase component 2 [Gelidium kathyanniae]AYO27963.1 anthranilate synthase component 2 [Gelidium kathyanniae]
MTILIIDNYDSFTQNLVQYVGHLGFSIKIARNDEISVRDIDSINPRYIILSPGPGTPQKAGNLLNLIENYAHRVPILGVCLGHQAIGHIFGGKIKHLGKPVHGKVSRIWHNNNDLFKHLPNPFYAARYHSLIVDTHDFPDDLEITAWTEEGLVMACRHRKYKYLQGVQFHPESVWTQNGHLIVQNFLFHHCDC